MKELTQREVMDQYPVAFQALPECYQADSCLEFHVTDGFLTCGPKPDQEDMLGVWVSTFYQGKWETEHFQRYL